MEPGNDEYQSRQITAVSGAWKYVSQSSPLTRRTVSRLIDTLSFRHPPYPHPRLARVAGHFRFSLSGIPCVLAEV